MTARTFVDTNIWVYAVDGADPAKQAIAREVLDPATADQLVTSAQVLGEFYVTVTRKLARPVDARQARRMVEQMSRLPVVEIDAPLVAAAIELEGTAQLSYWDALVVVSAQTAGCDRLLTEDLAAGTVFDRVIVESPFTARRISEAPAGYDSATTAWTDQALLAELSRYEAAAREVGMRPNAVHSYWDYARRFLAWRAGDYRPRGATGDTRPVPAGPASLDELVRQVDQYARAVEAAGRRPTTIETYRRHALFFVRWLAGHFHPGRRLRT